MSQFLGMTIFLIVVAGLLLHARVELPWYASWIGQLPGDLIIRKQTITIYAPLTSSLLISLVVSFLLSLAFGKRSS
ncbi:MAG: hypothetical protein A3D96_01335 [Chlamydiae bacterium RIFCSPHIGHO2_12_FULL_44_59]|nr:MAG: hypothetical protein A2796_00910 [Chlamydiae bacterium RIFCSPHIGHO2_01_FULL_44_39]OGN58872.1 MAG: hypothetical protein A3C42_05030 [Chlamydiae bacterium RIFCSPHIGHO2_02_FULL_45_9]OGN60507.1 MAG: hypothetical protein A3D96_01335 [Chlamydiae bacterium RIFCSPHIGHO2_12_FULL_44_59]OGN65961.1 MAG: hypothetical protein A2978_04625 [Chlamydiae bacterium RIFCSPLOWO2_01_FULL_44_52]OGN68776.1 MAG: hypothetical protein A3I67_00285 [Chlamydiae bacterium RIFCSPLOWO2_02_FULL_45_22]OGN70417.1 MAG: hyp